MSFGLSRKASVLYSKYVAQIYHSAFAMIVSYGQVLFLLPGI